MIGPYNAISNGKLQQELRDGLFLSYGKKNITYCLLQMLQVITFVRKKVVSSLPFYTPFRELDFTFYSNCKEYYRADNFLTI